MRGGGYEGLLVTALGSQVFGYEFIYRSSPKEGLPSTSETRFPNEQVNST